MGSGRGRSVLLVDDDVDLRFVANIALTRVGGFDVTSVGSVAAARAALGAAPPDVILLDVELPDQDGPSFAAELAVDEALAHVPVILLTGHLVDDDTLPTGIVGAIHKPFDALQLGAEIRRICGWA